MSEMTTAARRIHSEYEKRSTRPIQQEPAPGEYTNRYIWYPAEDIPHAEATAGYVRLLRDRARQLGIDVPVPSGFIERCRVAPILSVSVWERADSVPSEMRRNGRGRTPGGDFDEFEYIVPAGHIFSGVMEQYAGWGVTELTALTGMEPGDFLELNIDETFFPQKKDRDQMDPETGRPLDLIPRAYTALNLRIDEVVNDLPRDLRRNTLEAVARDMKKAIIVARAFDTALVDEEETRQPLRYSLQGLRALSRLERQRRDHALNEMAKKQGDVIDALPEVLKVLTGQGAAPQGITAQDLSDFAEKVAAAVAKQFAAPPATPSALPLPEGKPSSARK